MADINETLNAQLDSMAKILKYFGRNNELFQVTIAQTFQGLAEIEDNSEKIQFLKENLKSLIRLSIEHKEHVYKEWTTEEQINNLDSVKEAINQCIEFTKDLLGDYLILEETDKIAERNPFFTWLGTPSQFGFIFLELAKNGFIEIPSTNGEASYSKYAKNCFNAFDFKKETTQENLIKEMNPRKNSLSETVRAKFCFPNLKDI